MQNQGIGSRLITEGVDACRRAGCGLIVVLGEADYYGRFGFQTASRLGLQNEYGAEEAFMAVELQPHAMPLGGGLVQYAAEFGALEE